MLGYPTPGTKVACKSTGGVITYTRTGYTHTGGQKYSGKTAEVEEQPKKPLDI
jgi:hypothetical protein